jgi:hypothetical protein
MTQQLVCLPARTPRQTGWAMTFASSYQWITQLQKSASAQTKQLLTRAKLVRRRRCSTRKVQTVPQHPLRPCQLLPTLCRTDNLEEAYNQGLACCTWVPRSRWPATALTAGRPPSDGTLGEAGPERARDKHMGVCRMVTGPGRRRPCQARHGCMSICVIYVECSRSWQFHHRCASPHTGETPPGASAAARRDGDRTGWTRLTPVDMAPSLIREHLYHTRTLRVRGDVQPNGRSDPLHLDTDP